jgi:hypothetical protein
MQLVPLYITAGGCHGMKEENHEHETPAHAWQDCHTLPQSLYAASCKTVLASERWTEDVAPWMRFVAGVEPAEVGLSLPGIRLVTRRSILAVINCMCFDCKITL